MPTTIAEAFAAVALDRDDIVSVRWGTKPTTSKPGVYIVSLTESLDTCNGKLIEAPLAAAQFERWMGGVGPEDGTRPKAVRCTSGRPCVAGPRPRG